jgi:hypothetical protein
MSFPEPLIECPASLAESLRGIGSNTCIIEENELGRAFSSSSTAVWGDPREKTDSDEVASLVPLLEIIYKRPQCEMLQTLCDSLVPFFRIGPHTSKGRLSEIFSELLTRKGVSARHSMTLLR